MEFRILGSLEVLDGETPIEVAGSKRRALLALLLLHANEVVRTDRLIEDLWGQSAPRDASGALHNHVSRLRKTLGSDVLARREWGYVLRVPPDAIDLSRFMELIAAAAALPARERSAKLTEALGLWRGPPLANLAAAPGLQVEIARLEELRLATLERRIDADLEAGRHAELVGEIGALIAAEPLREHLRWQLILALYRAGRQAESLEIYRETWRVLTEELGIEPSPALKDLEKAILRQDPALAGPPISAFGAAQAPPVAERSARRRRVYAGSALLAVLGAGVAAAVALTGGESSPPQVTKGAIAAPPVRTRHVRIPIGQHRPVVKRRPHVARSQRVSGRTVVKPVHITTTVVHVTTTKAQTSRQVRHTKAKKASTQETTVTAPISAITITDDFSSLTADPAIWNPSSQGAGPTYSQQNGSLELTVPADAVPGGQYNSLSVAYSTVCRFDSDFDARVDYQLLEWPAANGVGVGLDSWIFPRPNSSANRASSVYNESYNGDIGSHFNTVDTTDVKGSLRLARTNGIETAYYAANGKWVALERQPAAGGATIALQIYANGADFAHKEVRVAFDNFSLKAPESVCS